MKARSWIVGAVVVALAVIAWLTWAPFGDVEPPQPVTDDAVVDVAPRPQTPPAPSPEIRDGAPSPSARPSPAEARAAVERARHAHTQAVADFEDAKTRLDDIEHEIIAVERFVDDIVERGEDPTDFTFEGLERLNPVIERFDELVIGVEDAEQRMNAAARELEAAEQALETVESR